MSPKTLPLSFAAVGLFLPAIIVLVDQLSASGWWPRWVIYLWPTSYMLIANSAIMDATAYTIIVFSAVLNALIYGLIGLIIYFITRAIA